MKRRCGKTIHVLGFSLHQHHTIQSLIIFFNVMPDLSVRCVSRVWCKVSVSC